MQVDIESPVEVYTSGNDIVLSRVHKHDRVTGFWLPGKGRPVLVIGPEGAEAALDSEIAKEVIRSGRPLLAVNLFAPDPVRSARASTDTYFLSYNRSDDAERVQDIVTALMFLHGQTKALPDFSVSFCASSRVMVSRPAPAMVPCRASRPKADKYHWADCNGSAVPL